jgi:hypothetical protein
MSDPLTEALAEAVAARVVEKVETLAARPRYYTAATAPIERRAWNRAVKEIRAFKPGRQVMVLADDLHAWIERQSPSSEPKAPAHDPLSYESFAAGVRHRRSRPAA